MLPCPRVHLPNATLEHLTALHRRLLSDANITLAPLAHPTSHAAPTSGPIVIHPGSGSRDKCWPAEHYHALTTTLRDAGHTIQPVFGEAEAHTGPMTNANDGSMQAPTASPPSKP